MPLRLDKDNKDQDEFHPLKYDKKNFWPSVSIGWDNLTNNMS